MPSTCRFSFLPGRGLIALAASLAGFLILPRAAAATLELAGASLVLAPGMTGPEQKAAQMLVEEVEKRSQVRWPLAQQLPSDGHPVVVLGRRTALLAAFPDLAASISAGPNDSKPEGYHLVTLASGVVIVAGNDARGVLYGAGRLLRLMDYTGETAPDRLGSVTVAAGLDLATAPRYALRGDQMGYRPKTNAYDGWTKAMWEQYIRDLVIFGANAVEGIPPRSDDRSDSPHFTLPPMQMMIEQSRICQEYGIQYWVWYPAMDRDNGNPATVAAALKEWGHVLEQLPRVDAVFVPGGDPGSTAPKILFPFLEKQAAQLRRLHPGAKLWMSNQGFNGPWMEDFFQILQTEPTWLEGIVFGPQQRLLLDELRARVPRRYKMRFYPDITHSLASQYPAADWDFAYAATENREIINPRPVDEAAIFHRYQPLAEYGFLNYSEGCNDDVNKCVWSCLGWDPNEDVLQIVRDYSHYFIGGGALGEGFAQGLMALERNWRGPLLTNEGVYTTLEQFQDLERTAAPAVLENWRFQEGLYRAYYDALDRARLIAETRQEEKAMEELRRAHVIGSLAAIAAAERALAPSEIMPAAAWRARVFELAEALFQSIHMQLSVPRYKGEAVRRGANLDLIDYPLNDAPYLFEQFAAVRAVAGEADRLRLIDGIINWTDPGPGGFYDNLGDAANRPHLVMGKSYAEDPAYDHSPMIGFAPRIRAPFARISSSRFAETLHDQPLEMQYHHLDRSAHYKVRVVYGTESETAIQLVANGRYAIHPLLRKDPQAKPHEFDIPAAATAGGDLLLSWTKQRDDGGTGRGVQVAEVWLIRVPSEPTP
ncbi:MAG TPA: hypothetical protein VHC86_02640 [Opitutaceae bacterium]|nr:hypothetical protein [Opitutaceae bacterium]